MIKKLLLIALCGSAWATTTVSGNLKNLGTVAVSSGSFVRFYLRGCGGNQPRVSGTAIIAPTLGNVYYFDFVPNASGAISGTLYSTRDVTGLLGGDIECGGSTTAVWYGFVPFLNGKAGPETPIHALNTATFDISNISPITTNPVITAPTGDTTYMRLDAGNSPTTGAWGFNKGLTSQSVNGELWVGSATGQYASLSAAVTAATTGQRINIAAFFTDTWSAGLTISKDLVIHMECTSAINQNGNNPLTISAGSYVSIVSDCGEPFVGITDRVQPRIYGYTGTSGAITVGSASTDTPRFKMRGIAIDCGNSCGAGAIGLNILRVVDSYLEQVSINQSTANANTCLVLDGTGTASFVGGVIIDNFCTGYASNATGWKLGTFSDGVNVIGGYINLSGPSGTVGIYKTGSTSAITHFHGTTVQAATTCLKVDSVQGAAIYGYIHFDAGCSHANSIVFAAGSTGNYLISDLNASNAISDSGSHNSVIGINGLSSFNDAFWHQNASNGNWQVTDTVSGTFGIQLFNTLGAGNGSISYPFSLALNTTGTGSVLFQTAGVTKSSIDFVGSYMPAVAGGTNIGSAALPHSRLCLGQSANNSACLTPTFTAARTHTPPDATGTYLISGNGDGTHAIANQTKRVSGCATGAAQFNTCDTTVTWTTAFADANYTAHCIGDVATSGVPLVEGIDISAAKTGAAITVRTIALTAVAAQFTTIDCTAIHD